MNIAAALVSVVVLGLGFMGYQSLYRMPELLGLGLIGLACSIGIVFLIVQTAVHQRRLGNK